MKNITNRIDMRSLARQLDIHGDWYEQGISAVVRGAQLDSTGFWGAEAEGKVATGQCPASSIEQYVIVRQGNTKPVAAVNLADLLSWASSLDPDREKKIKDLEAKLAAAQAVIAERDRRLIAGDANANDPALSWPLYLAYEADANWAEEEALRCMASIADGNKILPGGKPAKRDCRTIIEGGNIVEILGNLRQHIAQVEHITPE